MADEERVHNLVDCEGGDNSINLQRCGNVTIGTLINQVFTGQRLEDCFEELKKIMQLKNQGASNIGSRRECLETLNRNLEQLIPEVQQLAGALKTNWKDKDSVGQHDILQKIDSARIQIEACKSNDEKYKVISSETLNRLVGILKANGIIVLDGVPGSGKTFLALNALNIFMKENYDPIIVRNFEEMTHYIDTKQKRIILVEDMLGRYTMDADQANQWDNNIDEILSRAKSSNLFVFTIRTNIMKAAYRRRTHEKLTSQDVHIEITDDMFNKREILRLYSDKKKIHLTNEHILRLIEIKPQGVGFPFLCSQMKGSFDEIVEIFLNPKDVIRNNIKRMVRPVNIEYITLLLTLLFHDNLNKAKFYNEETDHIMDNIKKMYGIPQDIQEIFESADSLEGTYLKRDGDSFLFINDLVIEVFFKIAGEENLDFLFQKSPIHYISTYVEDFQDGECFNKLIERFSNEFDVVKVANCSLWQDNGFLFKVKSMKGINFFYKRHANLSLFEAFSQLGYQEVIGFILENQDNSTELYERKEIHMSAIKLACQRGDQAVLDVLAPFEQITEEIMALSLECKESVKMLEYLSAKGGSIFARSQSSENILIRIIKLNKKDVLQYLWSTHLNEFQHLLEHCRQSGKSALQIAMEHESIDCVEFLLSKSQDRGERDEGGNTILHSAAEKCDLRLMQIIIQSWRAHYFDASIKGLESSTFNELIRTVNSTGMNALHLASMSGDVECMDFLIQSGIPENSRTSSNMTILHIVAVNGQLDAVKYILEKAQGLINIVDKTGRSALHYATLSASIDIVRTLIRAGADPNITDNNSDNIFHFAAVSGSLEMVKYIGDSQSKLIKKKACQSWTALHLAAQNQSVQCIELLLQFGLSLYSRTVFGHNIFHIATANGNTALMIFLMKNHPHLIKKRDEFQNNALHIAAIDQGAFVFDLLVKNGFELQSVNCLNDDPFHVAVISGNKEVLMHIINKYPSVVHAVNVYGLNAVHLASIEQSGEIVTMLIDAGIEITGSKLFDLNPLHIATFVGNIDAVKALVNSQKKGIRSNAIFGLNPLHIAVLSLYKPFLLPVLDSLIPVFYNFLTFLKQHKNAGFFIDLVMNEIKEFQKSHYVDKLGFSQRSCEEKTKDIIEYLLNEGFAPESETVDGMNAFHLAVLFRHEKTIQCLVDNAPGVLESVSKHGWNALHFATMPGMISTFLKISDATKDVNMFRLGCDIFQIPGRVNNLISRLLRAKTFYGNDQMKDSDIIMKPMGSLEILRYLIESGLNPEARTKYGQTIAHFAAMFGNSEALKFVAEKYEHLLHIADDAGLSPLHTASIADQVEIIQILVGKGLQPATTSFEGRNCLHFAVYKESMDAAKYLIDNFDDILPLMDNNGWNALHHASVNQSRDNMAYLIKAGIKPNTTTKAGVSILHIAAGNGNLDVVRYVAENHRSLLHRTDKDGWNALHHASVKQNIEMVSFLIDAGINPGSITKQGLTCLLIAIVHKNTDVIKLILLKMVKTLLVENIFPFLLHQILSNWI